MESMDTHEGNAAGASAQREYERRRAKDEAMVRATWGSGRLGRIAVALTDEKQSTAAWKSGVTGESKVGAHLDAIASGQIIVLHDRRIPRTRANIDHIVVTRAGVWVVDAKRYQGKRPALSVEGGLFRPRVERLIVGGDRTKLVDGVLRQVRLVSDLVGPVPVVGTLCFVDADWPMFGGAFRTRGVEVLWPKKLVKMLTAAGGPLNVAAAAAAIAGHFPPA